MVSKRQLEKETGRLFLGQEVVSSVWTCHWAQARQGSGDANFVSWASAT